MIQADIFCRQAQALGFWLYTGVPCSYLKPFINYTIDGIKVLDGMRYDILGKHN